MPAGDGDRERKNGQRDVAEAVVLGRERRAKRDRNADHWDPIPDDRYEGCP